jgi:hypothetical protein
MEQANLTTQPLTAGFLPIGKNDPILQELWEIKSLINRDAHYSVKERMMQLEGFTIEKARLQAGLRAVQG